MKTRFMAVAIAALMFSTSAIAQDSARVAATLHELLSICRNVDFSDPKSLDSGFFYKAASYIVYAGDDEKRRWKSPANYRNADEKEQVDEICTKINSTVNQDSSYRVVHYSTNKESEGEWHVIGVQYRKNGKEKKAAFAFLKVNDRFLLGDID